MKAIVHTHYGPPAALQLQDVATPTPGDDEVLIRVHAASLNAADWITLRGKPVVIRPMIGGMFKPKHPILGADVAGRVEAVGRNVTEFRPGDEVFGDLSACGWGAFAEYVAAPARALALKPAGATFEQAAAMGMAAVTALQGLRDKGKLQAGHKVLINGASGGVGTFAVQIAKAFGAEVTAVCSTRNVAMAREIGADHVIDYTREDFTRGGQRYDVIMAANGYQSIAAYKRLLNPNGTYVMTGGSFGQMLQAMALGPLLSRAGGQRLGNLMAQPRQGDLVAMKELAEAGKVVPVIDRAYPLSEAADAFGYLGEGHARGKVVITVAG